jgi:hypothetical protein
MGHLAPMIINCPCDPIGRALSVRVTFKNHCVTQAYDPVRHDISEIVFRDGPGRHRVFCPTRYRLSHGLPQLMTELPTRRVHQTSQARNYLFAAPMAVGGCDYLVFFMLQRAAPGDGIDLRLTVESAYASDQVVLKKRPRAIRFLILARKVLMGEVVRFAPR